MEPIIVKAKMSINTFYIFRPDDTEVEVKVITSSMNEKHLSKPVLKSKNILTEIEKNKIYKLIL